MRILNGDQMRQVDNTAIQYYGIPGIVLMENAGIALSRAAGEMLGGFAGKKVVVFAGGGNNGGDGFVVARHLHNKGAAVRIFLLANPDSFLGDAKTNWEILGKMGLTAQRIFDKDQLDSVRLALWGAELVIDAIFGTGLKDDVRGMAVPVINIINESQKPVLACDIPSGISSFTGQPLGVAVKAKRTVTFGFYKLGLVLPTAFAYTGELQVADISLPLGIEEEIPGRMDLIDREFCSRWLKPRHKESHKGNFGHVLMLAGSPAMPGAAILAAKGVLRSGAGLLTAAVPSACRMPLLSQIAEAMLLPCEETEEGLISPEEALNLAEFEAGAYLIGPGMGRNNKTVQLIKDLLQLLQKPTVIDADALFAVAKEGELLRSLALPMVMTPHPGEMARLLDISIDLVQEDRINCAKEAAKEYGAVIVLKGAGSVIATPEGRILINSTGNPGMATGGSGDVLGGMIASMMAQGQPPTIAAACAVWLHGRAGDIAVAKGCAASLLAGDIADNIAAAFREVNVDL